MKSQVHVDSQDINIREPAVSAAKIQLFRAGAMVTRESIQLHGGVGVTDEHDIGLFFKRMISFYTLFGDEAFHTERFSRQTAKTAA